MSMHGRPVSTVMTIAVAGLIAFTGTFMGALRLALIAGLAIPPNFGSFIVQHPYLQLYGFIYLFIIGVSYALIPRFENRTLPWPSVPYVTLSLFLVGLILAAISSPLGNMVLVSAGILYAITLIFVVGKPKGYLAVTEYYFIASALFLPLTMIVRALNEAHGYPAFSFELLQLSLLGFPAMMIFGVKLRTIHFRVADLRKREAAAALILFVVAAGLAAVSSMMPSDLLKLLSSVLYLAGTLLFFISLQIFKDLPAMMTDRMTVKDRERYIYFTRSLRFASLWLLAGLVVGVAYSAQLALLGKTFFALRDIFVHSLSVGFIGSTIVGYAPTMLPSIISRKAPHKGLSLWPLYLLNIGNVLRVAGSFFLEGSTYLWPAVLAGPVVLSAMALFMLMIHRLRTEAMKSGGLMQIAK